MTKQAIKQQTGIFVEERTVLKVPTNLARYKRERLVRMFRKELEANSGEMTITLQRAGA
ncbi:MAG: hypothetical protein NXH95_20325 [Pseudomonadaceae bacterium]|nr:hypothetical protein [Pseudomonadaceae bacterium]